MPDCSEAPSARASQPEMWSQGKATPAERSPGCPPCSSAGAEEEAGATVWGLGRESGLATAQPGATRGSTMHRQHILFSAGSPTCRSQPRVPVTEELRQTAPPKGQVLVTSWLSPFPSLFSYPRGQSGPAKANRQANNADSVYCVCTRFRRGPATTRSKTGLHSGTPFANVNSG